MPGGFAHGLGRLLRQFVNSTTSGTALNGGDNTQTPQQNELSISSGSPSVHTRPVGSSSAQNGFHKTQTAQSQFTSPTVSVQQSAPQGVLLVVKRGTDHRLA